MENIACGNGKGTYFFALFIAYIIALFVIAHRDDRFLKDYVKFTMLPFSFSRFGPAALLNVVTAIGFFIIVALPHNCG